MSIELTHHSTAQHTAANSQALLGDNILLASIVLSAVAAVALGANFVESQLAWGASGVLLALTGLIYLTRRGTLTSSLVLAFVLSSFVELHIQLAQGMTEFHFGVSSLWRCCWCTSTGGPSYCRQSPSPYTTCFLIAYRPQATASIA